LQNNFLTAFFPREKHTFAVKKFVFWPEGAFHGGMTPPGPKPPAQKRACERPFHNDWFFASSYILLGIFIVAQFFLIFWMDLFH